jgi:hypothetical protein
MAASAGYKFRHAHLDGLWVASTYLDRLRRRDTDPITRTMREYNEDDVRSVLHVCEWAERLCGASAAHASR